MEKRRRGQGPRLHLKLSNEIYNNNKNEAAKIKSNFLQDDPPPKPTFSSHRQTEEGGLMGSVT